MYSCAEFKPGFNDTSRRPSHALESAALNEERDRFLSEFWAKALSVKGRIDAQTDKPAARTCSLEASHRHEFQLATVCQTCYARLQQRVDLLEAALRMDLKETTKVIYDAVWSDSSDPSKTYHNAAKAVLAKLHRRAGISAMLESHQPLAR